MITDKQLLAFTQFVGDVIDKEPEKEALLTHTISYFGVCPKEAKELIIRCEELEYIEQANSRYMIKTV